MRTLIRAAANEGRVSRLWRLLRSVLRYMVQPEGMNHYCPGKSGSGEWSQLSDTGICRYCMEPIAPLRDNTNAVAGAIESPQESLIMFRRNGRWGTCEVCPRDATGTVLPENCVNTDRVDHQRNAAMLAAHVIRRRK